MKVLMCILEVGVGVGYSTPVDMITKPMNNRQKDPSKIYLEYNSSLISSWASDNMGQ